MDARLLVSIPFQRGATFGLEITVNVLQGLVTMASTNSNAEVRGSNQTYVGNSYSVYYHMRKIFCHLLLRYLIN